MSEGGLEPPCPLRALAPQASASAYSATRTYDAVHIGWLRVANRARLSEARGGHNLGWSGDAPREPPRTGPAVPKTGGRCDDRTVTENPAPEAQDEVVDICRDLIRIDTTNPGDHSGPGERAAAEHVAGLLSEVGLEPVVLESHPKRTSLVARIEGEDPARPALLIHGHLDVVPANAEDWARHPFGAEIADGCVWGRGAIDM